MDWKDILKKNFTVTFLKSTLSVLRCTLTGRINLKIFLGYTINYISKHLTFYVSSLISTRKASNLTFVSFQLQVLNVYSRRTEVCTLRKVVIEGMACQLPSSLILEILEYWAGRPTFNKKCFWKYWFLEYFTF